MSDESKVNQEILTNNTVGRDLNFRDINQIYQAPAPPKYIPTYSIPYAASTNFVGREGVLERLAKLHASRGIVAVVGMPGVGKTELAVQYAHKHGKSYGGGCYWFNMLDRVLTDKLTEHVLREFKLDLPSEIADKRELAQWRWAQWERNLSADSRVLLVLDNVDEVSQIGRRSKFGHPHPNICRDNVATRPSSQSGDDFRAASQDEGNRASYRRSGKSLHSSALR